MRYLTGTFRIRRGRQGDYLPWPMGDLDIPQRRPGRQAPETVRGLWTRPGVIVKAYGHRVDGKISLGETRGLDWHKIFQMKLLSL